MVAAQQRRHDLDQPDLLVEDALPVLLAVGGRTDADRRGWRAEELHALEEQRAQRRPVARVDPPAHALERRVGVELRVDPGRPDTADPDPTDRADVLTDERRLLVRERPGAAHAPERQALGGRQRHVVEEVGGHELLGAVRVSASAESARREYASPRVSRPGIPARARS